MAFLNNRFSFNRISSINASLSISFDAATGFGVDAVKRILKSGREAEDPESDCSS
jgi:hypothetical protein